MPAARPAASRSPIPAPKRTEPVSPTSPTNAVAGGGGVPQADEATAAARARSHAGSSIRMPPAVEPGRLTTDGRFRGHDERLHLDREGSPSGLRECDGGPHLPPTGQQEVGG